MAKAQLQCFTYLSPLESQELFRPNYNLQLYCYIIQLGLKAPEGPSRQTP